MQPPKLIFDCFHHAYPPPINDYTAGKDEDGTTHSSGLCRSCHRNHCEEVYLHLKQYWLGRIVQLKEEVVKAMNLNRRHNWMYESRLEEALELLYIAERDMETELREVWVDYERRWGQ